MYLKKYKQLREYKSTPSVHLHIKKYWMIKAAVTAICNGETVSWRRNPTAAGPLTSELGSWPLSILQLHEPTSTANLQCLCGDLDCVIQRAYIEGRAASASSNTSSSSSGSSTSTSLANNNEAAPWQPQIELAQVSPSMAHQSAPSTPC